VEIEVKFQARDAEDLERLPAYLAALPVEVHIGDRERVTDLYLDTGDWRLFRAGYACRMRWRGGHRWLGLKGLDPPRDGVVRRAEYECRLPAGVREPAEIPPGVLDGYLDALRRGAALRPLFELLQLRKPHLLRRADGLVVEASADEVRFEEGDRRVVLHQVELELKAGPEEGLHELARLLARSSGWKRALGSKFEQGLLFAGLQPLPLA